MIPVLSSCMQSISWSQLLRIRGWKIHRNAIATVATRVITRITKSFIMTEVPLQVLDSGGAQERD